MSKRGERVANKLTEEQKVFLVQRLACFESPKEAIGALNTEYGISITPPGCRALRPDQACRGAAEPALARAFRGYAQNIFAQHREPVPEVHKAVRVRALAHASRAFKGPWPTCSSASPRRSATSVAR